MFFSREALEAIDYPPVVEQVGSPLCSLLGCACCARCACCVVLGCVQLVRERRSWCSCVEIRATR
jgi:hypothetical protein